MKKLPFLLLLFLLLSFPAFSLERETHIVKRITDGDTLVLDDDRKVRLIGVDTPEMHDKERNAFDAKRTGRDVNIVNQYARKAKNFVTDAVEGEKVSLEFDEANAYLAHKDKYGRLLAYVYREKDGLFINQEIIKEGYGFSYGRFPYKHLKAFRELEKEAKGKKKGMWS